MSIKNSESDGHRPSTEVKSPVQDVDTSLQPKVNHAGDASPKVRRSGKRSSVVLISDTLTATSRDTADPSIPVVTGQPQPTLPSDDNQDAESSQTGGPPDLTVTAAVRRDLAEVAIRDPKLAISGLAALALALAHQIDGGAAASAIPMCAGQLRDALDRLRELCPPEQKADEVDELRDNVRSIRGGSGKSEAKTQVRT